jgi:cell division protein FtsL
MNQNWEKNNTTNERKEKIKMTRIIIVCLLFLALAIPIGMAKSQTYGLTVRDETQNIINRDFQDQIDKLKSKVQTLEWEVKALSK